VALLAAVEEVVQMLEHAGRPEVKVEISVPAELGVRADAGQLRQLLWNLCLNALQAMPGAGRLEVGAARTRAAAPQARADGNRNERTEEGAAWVEIRVSDTGVGIPPEVQDRIFDPFFTTRAEGTGLGLSTVHRIVESHAGSLRVESAPGCGTTIWVVLPEAREER
jgi:signal transduction histidine kinase